MTNPADDLRAKARECDKAAESMRSEPEISAGFVISSTLYDIGAAIVEQLQQIEMSVRRNQK